MPSFKQFAIVLDNSGSMYHPTAYQGQLSTFDKIHEAAVGSKYVLDDMIAYLNNDAASQFAVSLHRFASTYERIGDQAIVESGNTSALTIMQATIGDASNGIENQSQSQAAVGSLTDIYEAVRQAANYMVTNPPAFSGTLTAKVILLFTDGIQTILHNGTNTRAGDEMGQLPFSSLLAGNGIKLVEWGLGADAIDAVLTDLATTGAPNSENKLIGFHEQAAPYSDTSLMFCAHKMVDDNGSIPLTPVGRAPSGLLWEQFSLPVRRDIATGEILNSSDFDAVVDASTEKLILGLTWHARGYATVEAISPSGTHFAPGSPNSYVVTRENMLSLHVPNPDAGTWRVRVSGNKDHSPMLIDLMASGIQRRFQLFAHCEPFHLPAAGTVKVVARPLLDGKPARGHLTVTATLLGGPTVSLDLQPDHSFAGTMALPNDGLNLIRVDLDGKVDKLGSTRRLTFAQAQVGHAADPRFTLMPDTYERGGSYTVDVTWVRDGKFTSSTVLSMGYGIAVTSLVRLDDLHARAQIQVDAGAFIGDREAVSYNPAGESLGVIRVVAKGDGHGIGGHVCCLRFDATGRLVGVVLCDGQVIPVCIHNDRLQRLLEAARDGNLRATIRLDNNGCLAGVDICS